MTEELYNKMRREIRRWRTYRRKIIFVCAYLLAVTLSFMADEFNAGEADRMDFKKSDRRNNEAWRLRTDGNITFTVPNGFCCRDSVVGNTRVFFLEDRHETDITISTMNVADSPERINSLYKDVCDGKKDRNKVASTILADTTLSDKSYTFNIKVRKYTGNGLVVFWRFAALIDKTTGKAFLVSAYDQGNDDYLEQLLLSVRFFN